MPPVSEAAGRILAGPDDPLAPCQVYTYIAEPNKAQVLQLLQVYKPAT